MGIADRDYMREPKREQKPKKPRARVRSAENKPSLLNRIKFWFWRLRHGG